MQTTTPTRSVMNVPETADYLRVSESIIRRLIRQKRIPYFQIDGRYLFFKERVDAWVISSTIIPDTISTTEGVKKQSQSLWERANKKL